MIQDGFFTGAEYAAINANTPLEIYGVEDKDLFARDFQYFYHVHSLEKDIKESLKEIETALLSLSNLIWSDRLNEARIHL